MTVVSVERVQKLREEIAQIREAHRLDLERGVSARGTVQYEVRKQRLQEIMIEISSLTDRRRL